jgi:hypothetical protein
MRGRGRGWGAGAAAVQGPGGRVFDAPGGGRRLGVRGRRPALHRARRRLAREVLHVAGAALTGCGLVGLVLAATGAEQAAVATVGGVVPGFVLLAGGAWAATTDHGVPELA